MMKATMNANGQITLSAETNVEAYALRHWSEQATVMINDMRRMESMYWRGSMLLVSVAPQSTGDSAAEQKEPGNGGLL